MHHQSVYSIWSTGITSTFEKPQNTVSSPNSCLLWITSSSHIVSKSKSVFFYLYLNITNQFKINILFIYTGNIYQEFCYKCKNQRTEQKKNVLNVNIFLKTPSKGNTGQSRILGVKTLTANMNYKGSSSCSGWRQLLHLLCLTFCNKDTEMPQNTLKKINKHILRNFNTA